MSVPVVVETPEDSHAKRPRRKPFEDRTLVRAERLEFKVTELE